MEDGQFTGPEECQWGTRWRLLQAHAAVMFHSLDGGFPNALNAGKCPGD